MVKPDIRTLLAMLHDLVAAALAWGFAYLLRFNFELPDNFTAEMVRTLIWVAPLQAVILAIRVVSRTLALCQRD